MSLNVGTLQATLGLDTKPFESGLDDAVITKGGASLGAFGRLAETAGVDGAGRFSNGLSGLTGDLSEIGLSGGAMLAAGVAVAAGALAVSAYDMGEEFHQAFATLQTDTGATGEKLAALKDQVETIYADVPNAIGDVSSAVGVLEGRLGGAPAVIGPLAEQLLKLGNAFGGDPQQNAQQFADAMTRWQVPVKQGKQVLDEFAAASEASAIPVQTLMQGVAAGAPDFQLLNMSIKESIAWTAAFAKSGGDVQTFFTGIQHSVGALTQMQAQNAQQAQQASKQAAQNAQAERERVDAIAAAWRGVQKANEQVASAQTAYNALLSGGIERAVTDGRNQMRDATQAVTDAQADLIKSKQALDDLLKGPSEDDEAKARLKLAQATQAVQAAYTAQAKAQNALTDAQSRGISGTDLAALQDTAASATLNVTSAQQDQATAQQALIDMAPGSAASQTKIADAQRAVADASNKVTDAHAAQADTTATVTQQLGSQLDGSAMLASGQQALADAHDGVTTALQGVTQASQKQVSQEAVQAISTDALGGHYEATNKVLAQLGLTNASAADQTKGLTKWMQQNAGSAEALRVAQEAVGTRGAVQMIAGLKGANAALGPLNDAVNHSKGAVDAAAAAHETAGQRIAMAWHKLMDDLSPVFDDIEGIVADLAGDLDKAVTWWETDGVPRFKNGLDNLWAGIKEIGHDIKQWTLDLKGWIVDGWNDVFGFITGIPGWIGVLLKKLWHGVSDVAGDVLSGVTGAWDTVWGWIDGIGGRVASGVKGMWDGIKNEFETVITWLFNKWNGFADALGFNLPSLLGGGHIQLLPHLTVPKFHSGGQVPGVPGSEVPAILQAGETVRTSSQEAALQGALAVTGGVGGGGLTIVVAPQFHGPVAGRDGEKWVADTITRATKKGLDMRINPSAVRR